jgi:predicted alpha/beta-hydrolase family hydrolase
MLAAEDPAVADALLRRSYPLHPPARPGAPRTAHFTALRTPALFVHGTRDPFGPIDELRAALTLVPAPARLHVVEGAGHDLGQCRAALADAVAAELLTLTSRIG